MDFKIKQDSNLLKFKFWGGATSRISTLKGLNLINEAEQLVTENLGEIDSNGDLIIDEGELNDFIWFDESIDELIDKAEGD